MDTHVHMHLLGLFETPLLDKEAKTHIGVWSMLGIGGVRRSDANLGTEHDGDAAMNDTLHVGGSWESGAKQAVRKKSSRTGTISSAERRESVCFWG